MRNEHPTEDAGPPRIYLSAEVSALLNATRAAAAFYVVLHHLSGKFHLSGLASLPFRFGQEAVIIFFLLSGFVVHANERRRALHPKGYYWRRIRRIYPILIAAMVVSACILADNGEFASQFTFSGMLGTVLALQDVSSLKPGVIVDPFLGNSPLWSLSYEIAFYAVYPVVLRAFVQRPAVTTHRIGVICSASFAMFVLVPNHFWLVAAYFPIWWTGALAAEAYADGKRSWRKSRSPLAWLLVLSLLALGAIAIKGFHGVGVYPALVLRHFAFALLLLAAAFGPLGRMLSRGALRVASFSGQAAAVSFGVYVLHYPVMIQWQRPSGVIGSLAAAFLLLLMAWLVEDKLPRLLPAAPRA